MPMVIAQRTIPKTMIGRGLICRPPASTPAIASPAETVKMIASTAEATAPTVTAVGRSPSSSGSSFSRASSLRSS